MPRCGYARQGCQVDRQIRLTTIPPPRPLPLPWEIGQTPLPCYAMLPLDAVAWTLHLSTACLKGLNFAKTGGLVCSLE